MWTPQQSTIFHPRKYTSFPDVLIIEWLPALGEFLVTVQVCIYFRDMGAGLLLEKKIIGTVKFLVSCSGLLKNKYLEKTSWNELIRKGWMLLKRVGLRTREWTQKIKKQQQTMSQTLHVHSFDTISYNLNIFVIFVFDRDVGVLRWFFCGIFLTKTDWHFSKDQNIKLRSKE